MASCGVSFAESVTRVSVANVARALERAAMTRSSAVVADSPPLPPLNCETCEFVMGVYVEIAGNATTLAEFVQLFSDACHVIAPGLPVLQDLCDGVIKAIVDGIVPFLDDQLTTLAWDIPATFCSTFIPVCTVPCCSDPTAPEQLRLALTNGGASEMSITWTALNLSAESSVQWGPAPGAAGALPNAAPAVARAFTLGGWLGVFYSATMTGLPHGARIAYRVGSDAGGWSSVREFSTLPDSAGTAARPLVLVHIGDQGWGDKSNTTIARVGALVASGAVDGVIHTGGWGWGGRDVVVRARLPRWPASRISKGWPVMSAPYPHRGCLVR